jgi:hypothetical protein
MGFSVCRPRRSAPILIDGGNILSDFGCADKPSGVWLASHHITLIGTRRTCPVPLIPP